MSAAFDFVPVLAALILLPCIPAPELSGGAATREFDTRPLHATKTPLQSRIARSYPVADLNIYHLGMLHREKREARRRRYEALDPENRWQPKRGYAYLTDENDAPRQTDSLKDRQRIIRSEYSGCFAM